ncbi:hypothetical protein [Spiroplasma endosymbiont of Polydrusus cervinus]
MQSTNPKGPKISFGKKDLEYYKTKYELLKKSITFTIKQIKNRLFY